MSVEDAIRRKLLTLSAVTAITGTGDSAMIRPDRLHATDTLTATNAAVIVEVDDEEHLNALDGKSRRRMSSVTLRCRSRQKARARVLAEAIRVNGTNPGTGLAGATWTDSTDGLTYAAWLEDTNSSFTPDVDGSDQGFYDVFCDYGITHEEAP